MIKNKLYFPWLNQEVIELTKQHIRLLCIIKREIYYVDEYRLNNNVYRVFKSPKKYYCYKVKKI